MKIEIEFFRKETKIKSVKKLPKNKQFQKLQTEKYTT